jgi:membrane fusion protein (multidrug efflux system)
MKAIFRYFYLWGFVLLAACNTSESKVAQETRPTPVQVMEIIAEPREEVLRLLGTVAADREVKLAFKVGGKIKQLSFEAGDHLPAGSLLARLDTVELLARHQQVRENHSKARRDMDRMKALFKSRSIAQAKYQDARTAVLNTAAERAIVEDQLRHSRITTPFSGIVSRKIAEEGEIVGPGVPVAVLTQMDPILVKAAVPDNFLSKVRINQPVKVKVDSHPQKQFPGFVRRLATVADPLSRTFEIEIRLDNPDEILRPGLIAKVEIRHQEENIGIYIPLDAVVGFGTRPVVFVVNGQKAERRDIRTGDIFADRIEVLEGLAAGELLVVAGHEFLKNRQPVVLDRGVSIADATD